MVVGLTMLAALQQLEQAAGQNIAVFNIFALGSGIDRDGILPPWIVMNGGMDKENYLTMVKWLLK